MIVTVKPTETQIPRIYFTVPASSFGHVSVPHNLGDVDDDVIKVDAAAVLEEVVVREGGAVIGGIGKEGEWER
ncbi:hypothetical protein EV1_046782 [Malus domestica]